MWWCMFSGRASCWNPNTRHTVRKKIIWRIELNDAGLWCWHLCAFAIPPLFAASTASAGRPNWLMRGPSCPEAKALLNILIDYRGENYSQLSPVCIIKNMYLHKRAALPTPGQLNQYSRSRKTVISLSFVSCKDQGILVVYMVNNYTYVQQWCLPILLY